MNNGKAPSHDEMSIKVIRFMNEERKQELFGIFKQTKRDLVAPRDW